MDGRELLEYKGINWWFDEWMNEWINEWMNEWMKGWMSGCMDDWKDGRINQWLDGRCLIAGWMNELMNGGKFKDLN